jgi:hypothetical protein
VKAADSTKQNEQGDQNNEGDHGVALLLEHDDRATSIERKTVITITPLHNFFAPRLDELPGLVTSLPGAPISVAMN